MVIPRPSWVFQNHHPSVVTIGRPFLLTQLRPTLPREFLPVVTSNPMNLNVFLDWIAPGGFAARSQASCWQATPISASVKVDIHRGPREAVYVYC